MSEKMEMKDQTAEREAELAAAPCSPFPAIVHILRERRGLEPDDESEDGKISCYSPRKALEECCAWHIGDKAWAGEFLRWANGAGYSISENVERMGGERRVTNNDK